MTQMILPRDGTYRNLYPCRERACCGEDEVMEIAEDQGRTQSGDVMVLFSGEVDPPHTSSDNQPGRRDGQQVGQVLTEVNGFQNSVGRGQDRFAQKNEGKKTVSLSNVMGIPGGWARVVRTIQVRQLLPGLRRRTQSFLPLAGGPAEPPRPPEPQ